MDAFRYIEYTNMDIVRNLIDFLLIVLMAVLLNINNVLYFFLLLMVVLLDIVEQIMSALSAQSLMLCARLLEALAFLKLELKKIH